MTSRQSACLAVCIAALALPTGCGGSGGAQPVADEPSLAVTGFTPGRFDSEIPVPFTVSGSRFGAPGSAAIVRLEALNGTPFRGGSTACVDLSATVDSADRMSGVTAPCGVSGLVQSRITVLLDNCSTRVASPTPLATVIGPSIRSASPDRLLAGLPRVHEITVSGDRFGIPAGAVTVILEAAAGTPFLHGTADRVSTPCHVDSPTEIVCSVAPETVLRTAAASITARFASGAQAISAGPILTLMPEVKFRAADGGEGNSFGASVAVSGDTILAGTPFDSDGADEAGSACVFLFDGQTATQQATLFAPTPRAHAYFGTTVAVSGDTALVAATGDPDLGLEAGAVHVFERTGASWTWQQKLTAADGAEGDSFGWAVAIDGDTAVIGAPFDDREGEEDLGAVYVFTRTGTAWSEQAKLTDISPDPEDHFGSAVAISGETVVIGAPNALGGSGYVFVYQRTNSTWDLAWYLIAGHVSGIDAFGTAVAISGDVALVGAPRDEAALGSVTAFVRSGGRWAPERVLFGSTQHRNRYFGSSVALSGSRAIIGAYGSVGRGTWSGAVHVYDRAGANWSEIALLTPEHGKHLDRYGYAVAYGGSVAVVGAIHDDDQGDAAGAVYVH